MRFPYLAEFTRHDHGIYTRLAPPFVMTPPFMGRESIPTVGSKRGERLVVIACRGVRYSSLSSGIARVHVCLLRGQLMLVLVYDGRTLPWRTVS